MFSIFLAVPAVLAVPGTWAGYAFLDGSIAANGTVVSAVCDTNTTWNANTTIYPGRGEYSESVPQGYYSLSFECTGLVNFYVCGICAPVAGQTWSAGPHYNGTAPNFNLSVSKLASGTSCSYSCACSGGYCCSGATQYTAGTGTGTCQATACAAAVTTTTAAPSSGGGGAAATTTTTTTTTPVTTTTTTTLPPKEEIKTIGSIAKSSTGTFSFTETIVSDIEVSAKNDVTNPRLTVSQSSAVPAAVATAAPNTVYGYITVKKANVADADVSSVKVKFKVPREWITGSSIDESTITLMRYNNTWASLPTTKLSSDATYVYYEATSPGLSEFAITGKKAVTTTTQPVAPITTVPTTTQPPFVLPEIPGVSDTMLYIAIGIIAVIILAVAVWKFKLIRF